MEFLTEPVPNFSLEDVEPPKPEPKPDAVEPVPTRELMPTGTASN